MHLKINSCNPICTKTKKNIYGDLSDDYLSSDEDVKCERSRSVSLDNKSVVFDRNGKRRILPVNCMYEHSSNNLFHISKTDSSTDSSSSEDEGNYDRYSSLVPRPPFGPGTEGAGGLPGRSRQTSLSLNEKNDQITDSSEAEAPPMPTVVSGGKRKSCFSPELVKRNTRKNSIFLQALDENNKSIPITERLASKEQLDCQDRREELAEETPSATCFPSVQANELLVGRYGVSDQETQTIYDESININASIPEAAHKVCPESQSTEIDTEVTEIDTEVSRQESTCGQTIVMKQRDTSEEQLPCLEREPSVPGSKEGQESEDTQSESSEDEASSLNLQVASFIEDTTTLVSV